MSRGSDFAGHDVAQCNGHLMGRQVADLDQDSAAADHRDDSASAFGAPDASIAI
jgi:hypothetical protein